MRECRTVDDAYALGEPYTRNTDERLYSKDYPAVSIRENNDSGIDSRKNVIVNCRPDTTNLFTTVIIIDATQ